MPISRKFLVRALGVAVMPLFLAACGPDAQQRADLDAVERSGTSPAIYDKMVHEDQGTVYYLHREDFRYLHDNGVSQSVVDYMASTSPNYWGPGPYPFYGPYGGPGAYYGPGPYGPVIPIGIGIGIGGGGGYHRGWR
jgi:hypothetical protein